MRTMVFDTETSGLPLYGGEIEVQPHIIELGAAVYEGSELVAEFSQLIKPPHPIDAVITKITGITNEELASCSSFKDVWEKTEFRELLKSCSMLIAHNAEFDRKMLVFELTRLGLNPDEFIPPAVVDTVAEFYHVFGRRMKLTELHEKILGVPLAQTHRALDDVHALAEVCKRGGLLCPETIAS